MVKKIACIVKSTLKVVFESIEWAFQHYTQMGREIYLRYVQSFPLSFDLQAQLLIIHKRFIFIQEKLHRKNESRVLDTWKACTVSIFWFDISLLEYTCVILKMYVLVNVLYFFVSPKNL